MELAGLPEELLILIFSYLDLSDLLKCQLLSRPFRQLLLHTVKLQFIIQAKTAESTITSLSPTYARLRALQRHEQSWQEVAIDFTTSIAVRHFPSGIYDLTAGVYLLGCGDRTSLYSLKLPIKEPTELSAFTWWRKIDINHAFIDIGLCIFESDLMAVVLVSPTASDPRYQDIELQLLQFSTGLPHPLAHTPRFFITRSKLPGKPAVSIEIVGENLVLILTHYNHPFHPDDDMFVYDWTNGKLKMHATAVNCSWSGVVFISPDVFLIPNRRNGYLELWQIPSDDGDDDMDIDSDDDDTPPKPTLILSLPELTPGHFYASISCRAEPNPLGRFKLTPPNKMNERQDESDTHQRYRYRDSEFHTTQPFVSDPMEAIMIFHMRVVPHGPHPSRNFTIFVHRKAVLGVLEEYREKERMKAVRKAKGKGKSREVEDENEKKGKGKGTVNPAHHDTDMDDTLNPFDPGSYPFLNHASGDELTPLPEPGDGQLNPNPATAASTSSPILFFSATPPQELGEEETMPVTPFPATAALPPFPPPPPGSAPLHFGWMAHNGLPFIVPLSLLQQLNGANGNGNVEEPDEDEGQEDEGEGNKQEEEDELSDTMSQSQSPSMDMETTLPPSTSQTPSFSTNTSNSSYNPPRSPKPKNKNKNKDKKDKKQKKKRQATPPVIRWKEWGPDVSRWFNSDGVPTRWITTSCGQRTVFTLSDGGAPHQGQGQGGAAGGAGATGQGQEEDRGPSSVLIILDFNQMNVAKATAEAEAEGGLESSDEEGEDDEEQEQEGEEGMGKREVDEDHESTSTQPYYPSNARVQVKARVEPQPKPSKPKSKSRKNAKLGHKRIVRKYNELKDHGMYREIVEHGLGYIALSARVNERFEGVLMDEERLIGIRTDELDRVQYVDIMHIGTSASE